MAYLFLIGRILYGGFFVMAGINHFMNATAMAGYAGSKGLPAPRLGVLASGAIMVLGGLSILSGFRPEWGVLLLTLFLLPATFIFHNFWADTDPMARMNNMIHFQKNVALMGAAWMLLMVPQPWVFGVG